MYVVSNNKGCLKNRKHTLQMYIQIPGCIQKHQNIPDWTKQRWKGKSFNSRSKSKKLKKMAFPVLFLQLHVVSHTIINEINLAMCIQGVLFVGGWLIRRQTSRRFESYSLFYTNRNWLSAETLSPPLVTPRRPLLSYAAIESDCTFFLRKTVN